MTYLIRFVTHSCLVDDSWRIWYIFLHTPALFMTHDLFDTNPRTLRPCLWLMTYFIHFPDAHRPCLWLVTSLIHFPTHSGIVYDSWRIWYIFQHTPALFMSHDLFDTFSHTPLTLFMTHDVFVTIPRTLWPCLWLITYLIHFPTHSDIVMTHDVVDTIPRTLRPCLWRHWHRLLGTEWQHPAQSCLLVSTRLLNVDF